MRIVFMGPPGAGKGTQSERLTGHLEVPHLSTGEILRAACRTGTELGREAAEYYEAGKLVPDDIVMQVVIDRLRQPDCQQGCVFDGFPRTVAQAESLDEFLTGEGLALDMVLELEISREELVDRLAKRRRVDDSEAAIRERLRQYDALTRPVLDYYRGQNLLKIIPAEGTPDEVFGKIKAAVNTGRPNSAK